MKAITDCSRIITTGHCWFARWWRSNYYYQGKDNNSNSFAFQNILCKLHRRGRWLRVADLGKRRNCFCPLKYNCLFYLGFLHKQAQGFSRCCFKVYYYIWWSPFSKLIIKIIPIEKRQKNCQYKFRMTCIVMFVSHNEHSTHVDETMKLLDFFFSLIIIK